MQNARHQYRKPQSDPPVTPAAVPAPAAAPSRRALDQTCPTGFAGTVAPTPLRDPPPATKERASNGPPVRLTTEAAHVQALVERPLDCRRVRGAAAGSASTVLGNPGTCGRRRVRSYPRIRRQSSGSDRGRRIIRFQADARLPCLRNRRIQRRLRSSRQRGARAVIAGSTSVKSGLHRLLVPRELDRSGFALWSRRPSRLVCHQCQTNNNATDKSADGDETDLHANSTSRSLTAAVRREQISHAHLGGLRHARMACDTSTPTMRETPVHSS